MSHLNNAIEIAIELLNAIKNDYTQNGVKLNMTPESELYFDTRIEQILDSLLKA